MNLFLKTKEKIKDKTVILNKKLTNKPLIFFIIDFELRRMVLYNLRTLIP